ncbi:rod shape-determining protein [archaeon]|nr:rod shape-determining protein [archaeon]NDB56440.1 rod shape-determining protein [archaeon]NDB80486.1 rod shape-determining protein [archaeon]
MVNFRRTIFGGNDIAIDLGTANTLIYVKGVGVVVDEPTLLAISKKDGKILSIGKEAKKLEGRIPESIELVKPLRDGVISEIEMAEELVKNLLTRAIGRAYSRPRIVICVPNGVTSVEQRSIETAAHATGASEVYTIEEPMAASIGSNLNIFEPYGNMIIDIGGGTTEIAVISMGDIVIANSIRLGGEDMTEALIEWLRSEHQILVDFGIAESVKHAIGSAYQYEKEPQVTITGRDIVKGIPKQVLLEAADVRTAIEPIINSIIEAVRIVLSKTPPALVADIDKDGAWITGGGSLLRKLDKKIAEDLGIPINSSDDPLSSVVLGSGLCLERFEDFKSVLNFSPKPS